MGPDGDRTGLGARSPDWLGEPTPHPRLHAFGPRSQRLNFGSVLPSCTGRERVRVRGQGWALAGLSRLPGNRMEIQGRLNWAPPQMFCGKPGQSHITFLPP